MSVANAYLVGLSCLGVIAVVGWRRTFKEKRHSDPDQADRQRERSESGDPLPPRYFRLIDKIKEYSEKRRAKREKETPADRYSRRAAYGTWVIALAGIASVYVGWRQWSAINGQLKEMRAAAAQANKLIQVNADLATAAKSQAAATQLMAEATRDIQIDSRATITAALQIQSPPSGVVVPDQPANFTFFVSNNGFGTARDFRVWAKAEVHEFPLNSQIVVKTPRVAPTTLAKDGMSQPVIATTESPVAKSDFDAIQRGEKAVYIFGEATYLDPYQTAFDFPIRYIYGKGSPTPVPGDFTVAENPN